VYQVAQVKPTRSLLVWRRVRAALRFLGWTNRVAGSSLQRAAGTIAGEARLAKADQVHLVLKQAITQGELLPGTAIDKAALCLRFGVSRLPVTTALNRLAYEGLVLIEPQGGLLCIAHPAGRCASVDDGP
jgi:hypothetical protein